MIATPRVGGSRHGYHYNGFRSCCRADNTGVSNSSELSEGGTGVVGNGFIQRSDGGGLAHFTGTSCHWPPNSDSSLLGADHCHGLASFSCVQGAESHHIAQVNQLKQAQTRLIHETFNVLVIVVSWTPFVNIL